MSEWRKRCHGCLTWNYLSDLWCRVCKRELMSLADLKSKTAAINYPLSAAAVQWLCRFNGAPTGWDVPIAWRYAPNAACQKMLERKAGCDDVERKP